MDDKRRKSLVRIADVIRTGERLSTEDKGVVSYLLPDMEVAVSALPATVQGGDFHGIIYLGNSRTAIFIGDVAGHDFSSSIPAAEAIDYFDDNRDKLIHPHLFLRGLNDKMYKSLSSVGRFLTAAVCLLDLENNVLSYASAGHPPSLLYSSETGHVKLVGKRMLPVGFEEDLSFKLIQNELLPGDSIMLYTDGISSGRSAQKEEFGTDRMSSILQKHKGKTTAVHDTIADQKTFCENSPESDDRTIILSRRIIHGD